MRLRFVHEDVAMDRVAEIGISGEAEPGNGRNESGHLVGIGHLVKRGDYDFAVSASDWQEGIAARGRKCDGSMICLDDEPVAGLELMFASFESLENDHAASWNCAYRLAPLVRKNVDVKAFTTLRF